MSVQPYSAAAAETIFMDLLDRRDVILSEPGFDLADENFRSRFGVRTDWVEHSREAYRWSTRTPLALFYCGLLARATNPTVDPLSIQGGSGESGYNAAGLWSEVIYKHALDRIDLRRLKNVPLNNSPFNGKRRLSTDWENVSSASSRALSALFDWLSQVESMSSSDAEAALLSVLLAAPNAPISAGRVKFDSAAQHPTLLSLVEFADQVSRFISLNSDHGRRAQAFVAACLEVALPERISTPASVNDPSRRSPGDVKSLSSEDGAEVGALLVEVKDKPTRRQEVLDFVKNVRDFNPSASVGYAALANKASAEEHFSPQTRIPTSEELTRSEGMPVLVWKTPLDLLSQSAAWSGLPTSTVIWKCAHNYLYWLNHVDTDEADSPREWSTRLETWGFISVAPPNQAASSSSSSTSNSG
jgi:hypothetical protein